MEELKAYLVPIKQVVKLGDKVYLESESIPDGYISLQAIIDKTRTSQLGEEQIKSITASTLKLYGVLAGVMKHLAPSAVYYSSDYT